MPVRPKSGRKPPSSEKIIVPAQSILWRRLDQPGHECARLFFRDSSWHLDGTALFTSGHKPCRLDYRILCESGWRTMMATVAGWIGATMVEVDLAVDAAGCWWLNGKKCLEAEGCIDLDFAFSPSTNLLPIRRLDLAIGQEAASTAAWLRFPDLSLGALNQLYRRIDARTYRYERGGGAYATDLQVNAAGFVTTYPSFWEAEADSSSEKKTSR
ncbi:MAG: putative glycolipid-binding domain-containing protein [Deltaproteobacteria bacterium]|nr:putative glycolipid-binding domain-containing protein [Deltaproteobacteria bacterium]